MTGTTETDATARLPRTEPLSGGDGRRESPGPSPTPQRRGISVRVRITVTVALLVALALSGAGLLVYAVETQRIDEQTVAEAQQELDEFARSQGSGVDPLTQEPFADIDAVLRTFLQRNVPDDDELLVGWIEGREPLRLPEDPLIEDAGFREAAARLAETGGSTRIASDRGEVLLTAQPVVLPATGESGALVIVNFLAEDRGELLDTMRTYAIVSLLALLAVAGVAFWRAGRLLRPLRAVREAAQEIGETDLSRRLLVRGNDDITALTRTFNDMLRRLEHAFDGQRQFLDDAGHELRTPLTVLRGHVELLDTTDPEDLAETRELLLDEVDRMARLVGDLILLAKSDRPDFLDRRELDLARLTETVLAKARVLGRREWVLDSAAAQPVRVDEQRLTQALLQLADNAVKHTREGDEIAVGSAVITEGPRAGTAELWVRDTGPGVRLADHDRVFDRFGRSEVAPGDEGFGLGLSIVAAIARAHGGEVRIDHTYVDGARVVLSLPVEPTPAPTPEEAAMVVT